MLFNINFAHFLALITMKFILKETSSTALFLMTTRHGKLTIGEKHVSSQNKMIAQTLVKQIALSMAMSASGTVTREHAFTRSSQ